mgnify:CR=1 FL=1
MYKFIAFISVILRQFVIPNPFEALGEGLTVTIDKTPMLLSPVLLNWIAEPCLHAITFAVVGLYYHRGENPAAGSGLYLLFYCIHTFIIWLMSLAGFATWAVVLILVGYVVCHVLAGVLRNRMNGGFI